MDVYEELIRERSEGRSCALATIVNVVGSTPSYSCAKMLVREDGSIVGTVGGGAAEGYAIAAARDVLASGRSQMLSLNLHENPLMDTGMVCGGRLDIFVEAIRPAAVAYIFGAGHIGVVTARLARMIGLEVEVIDDRPEFANRDRCPDAREVHAGELAAITGGLRPDARSLIVIATRSHAFDADVLAWALGTPAGYIGMIGSKRKILTVFNKLRAEGVAAERFARVHAPLGLPIGADTPEEIAVAIAAEMIAHLRDAEAVRPLMRSMADCVGGGGGAGAKRPHGAAAPAPEDRHAA
ncbi:XdhC family protein [Azospirillum sp. ST 5-10]|uniref:XdhC family protein n=1 Tax=unclassified Azospirillum TaxID=2630922 RepID=UPI003F4A5951